MPQLIYTKLVDKSVLYDGFTIQTALLAQFKAVFGALAIGEQRAISIVLGGNVYDGILVKNQNFNRHKYPDHSEMYQVRYSGGSDFSKALNAVFSELSEFIKIQQQLKKAGELKGNIRIPEDMRCQIAFYASENPDVWIAEPIMPEDYKEIKTELQQAKVSEMQFEDWQKLDETATIKVKDSKVKIRVLDRQVGNNLKQLYGYRCQICGRRIAEHYGNVDVVDAHHIHPFVESLDNSYRNIMVLCPNHHRIVHAYHPDFKFALKEYHYPNGLHEKLALNLHL